MIYDLVISGGTVIDPVLGEYKANLGITEGKIIKISEAPLEGQRIIKLNGEVVSAGFIDIHMHGGELSEHCSADVDIFRYMALMGVTTAVGGNCGLGDPAIFGQTGTMLPVNYFCLAGHGDLREKSGCSDRYRGATDEEVKIMKQFLEEGLQGGALGLSFGLEYIPGTTIDELLQLSRVVARYPGKLVSAHYRYDADRSLEALAEMIIVARETNVKFQVSHLNSCTAFGQTVEGLKMLEAASRSGVDIMADAYPYDAFSTFIGSAVFDPGCFERMGAGYEQILVCEGKYSGRRCTEEIFNDLRVNDPDALVVAFVMKEDEVVETLKHPLVMIASDGFIKNGRGHPRAAGAFPRVLGRYVRERGDLDLVTAINKMTVMPAERLGLETKGRIAEGYDADITIFNKEVVEDRATFENPTEPPAGIGHVIVDGESVVENGRFTGKKTGVFIST
ncbi:MAG: N-acyl-D-amino-acid deacylase family protein [Bacillota bacterium]